MNDLIAIKYIKFVCSYLLQQCIGHLVFSCPLLTISSYSSQIPKSPLFFSVPPAVLLCHAHFKIYLFFQSDGLRLRAKQYPPALSQRTSAKKAKEQVHHSQCHDAKKLSRDDHCYFWKNRISFQIDFQRTGNNNDWFLVAHTVWTNRIADKKNILSIPCSRLTETKDQSIRGFDKDKF